MQYYQLYENNEEEKISAHVIVFDDGQTIVKWTGLIKSLVIHNNLDEFKSISVRDGRTLFQTY
jgi:hypothetical protein